jgi:hypothetical protein
VLDCFPLCIFYQPDLPKSVIAVHPATIMMTSIEFQPFRPRYYQSQGGSNTRNNHNFHSQSPWYYFAARPSQRPQHKASHCMTPPMPIPRPVNSPHTCGIAPFGLGTPSSEARIMLTLGAAPAGHGNTMTDGEDAADDPF